MVFRGKKKGEFSNLGSLVGSPKQYGTLDPKRDPNLESDPYDRQAGLRLWRLDVLALVALVGLQRFRG